MNDEHDGSSDRTPVRIVRLPEVEGPELSYLRTVQPGDARRLVQAYQEAVELAATFRAVLVDAGVITDDANVDALLNDAGSPLLRVQLTPEGMARFRLILERMAAMPDGSEDRVA
jgi:hypothetical protein